MTPPSSTTLTGGPVGVQWTTIVVEADPETKVYGSADPAFGYQILSGTLPGGVTPSGSLMRDPGENVGNYAIDEGTLSLPPAYTLVFDPSYLTITPAALTITAVDRAKTEGVQLTLGMTAFTTSKLFYSDTVSGVTLTSAGALAGAPKTGSPYPITPSAAQGSGLGNYAISYVNGQLTVLPPPVQPASPAPSKTSTSGGAGKSTSMGNGVTVGNSTTSINANLDLTLIKSLAIPAATNLNQTLASIFNQNSAMFSNISSQAEGSTPTSLIPTSLVGATVTAAQAEALLPFAEMSSDAYGNTHWASQAGWVEETDSTLLLKSTPQFPDLASSGLYAKVFHKDGQFVIAFRGSCASGCNSFTTDVGAGLGLTTAQYQLLIQFVRDVEAYYRSADVTLTGHSLGGGLASYAAGALGLPSITFNASRNPFSNANSGVKQLNVIVTTDAVGNPIGSAAFAVPLFNSGVNIPLPASIAGSGYLKGKNIFLQTSPSGFDAH